MESEAVAYIDESMRTYDGATTYYLCAAIDRGLGTDDIRKLKSLLPKHAKKLHWRDMGIELQAESLRRIASFELGVIIVSGRPVNMRKQERARRKCLEILLPLLDSAGVGSVVMESRNISMLDLD